MPSGSSLEDRIRIKQRRLEKLQRQADQMGLDTPPHILIEIEDLTAELAELTARRRRPATGPPAAVNSRPEESPLPACPFVAGPMITDPRLFVGRREPLRQITSRMTASQPISVNIVGERRIGKSSLLYHFFQTWEARVQSPGQYVVTYLDLQSAKARHREAFYRAVADALLQRPAVQGCPQAADILRQRPLGAEEFEAGLQAIRAQNIRPVLCLDEFEALLDHPTEFDDGFFDSLRSLTNQGALMLVAASRQPLQTYRHQHRLTSRFFNDGHILRLGEFTDREADDLVRLPASTVEGTQPALTPQEQKLARKWGGRHPCRLQIAAAALCFARQAGHDPNWARREFEAQVQNQFDPQPRLFPRLRRLGRALCWPVWDLPRYLGRLARRTGNAVDSLTNWLLGALILMVVILVLLGLTSADRVLALLHSLLGG